VGGHRRRGRTFWEGGGDKGLRGCCLMRWWSESETSMTPQNVTGVCQAFVDYQGLRLVSKLLRRLNPEQHNTSNLALRLTYLANAAWSSGQFCCTQVTPFAAFVMKSFITLEPLRLTLLGELDNNSHFPDLRYFVKAILSYALEVQ